MCKILIIPKTNKNKELRKFIRAAAPIMSKNDRDGFGYAALTADGLVAERWLNPSDAFQKTTEKEIAWRTKARSYLEKGEYGYNRLGDVSKEYHGAIVHARYATCAVNLANVHPFTAFNTLALVHNGIISNPEAHKPVHSTCDSESILKAYIAHDIAAHPENIQAMSDKLDGSYACGIINAELGYVDILHDDRSNLVCAYVDALDTDVFATTNTIIEECCKKCGFKQPTKFFDVKDGVLIRVHTSGEVELHKFTVTSKYVTVYSGGQYSKNTASYKEPDITDKYGARMRSGRYDID